MDLRPPNYSLSDFSNSVKELEVMDILDAVLQEIHILKIQCHRLGFGYKPKRKARPEGTLRICTS